MASVWLSHDRTLDRAVAIKFVVIADPRRKDAMVKSFVREARLAASVVHRNVVQVLDFGLHTDGTPFMVMEALEGDTLGDRFNAGAQFTIREVIQIGGRSLEGLIAVHDAGIVHRDLKPENIFLVEAREGLMPKLLDFGISRSLDATGRRASAVTTVAGRVIGTPEYMSPEQANGSAEITRRTDIYAMGVILYETIVGDVPYRSEHLGDLILQITHGQAQPVAQLVPEIGWPLSDVIYKAMQPDPADRYADAAEMLEAWDAAAEETARGAGAVRPLPERARDRHLRTVDVDEHEREDDISLEEVTGTQALSPSVTDSDGPTVVIREKSVVPPWAWVSVALSLLAVAAVAFVSMRGNQSKADNPARFIVVQAAGEATAAQPQADAPTETGSPAQGSSPAPSDHTVESPPEAQTPVSTAPRSKPAVRPAARAAVEPEVAVARAFARQKRGVVRCLEAHADTELPKLAVRLALDTQGKVERADVLPEPIASTPTGTCIQQAVAGMRFSPQAQPATYRVPLVTRRE